MDRHKLIFVKDGKPKAEIELKDDDARLVSLMLDYLYRMDYDDLMPSQKVAEPVEEAAAEPESPVAKTVLFFEGLADSDPPAEEAAISDPRSGIPEPVDPVLHDNDEWSFDLARKKRDKKKKKKTPQKLRLKEYSKDVETERLTINALMYALADKYGIDDLKALARKKFEVAVAQDWESQAFARAADLVFQTTPTSDHGLRSVVIRTLDEHRDLVKYEEIRDLLDSGNGIAWGLVQVLVYGCAEGDKGGWP